MTIAMRMNISRKNPISSTISGSLIANYTHADYRIGTATECITLKIDQYSEPLAQFLATSNQSCAAIISAYNPCSQLVSNEENVAAHESLRHFLVCHAYPSIESVHTDPAGVWPAEKSFFIPGIDIHSAKSLGQQFNQNAIVWIERDAIPRLHLLR
ncbi:DUF3293 domain-containing protein [Nitrosomonas sp. Is24]|uniref:DUF3293 domain-containing protein n=1 Tax=Nitrosomonas sp. Is24 TaxID=3080533 RepID=UPI00294AC583|nr:DUF3293 domain-containing protein [Nitrosomonas sp. Is24]MDV6340275.1 DUF3293 domain-containing protein [Nitrosomonas sp. Is24]